MVTQNDLTSHFHKFSLGFYNRLQLLVTGQNDIGQNGMDKMARTKWYG